MPWFNRDKKTEADAGSAKLAAGQNATDDMYGEGAASGELPTETAPKASVWSRVGRWVNQQNKNFQQRKTDGDDKPHFVELQTVGETVVDGTEDVLGSERGITVSETPSDSEDKSANEFAAEFAQRVIRDALSSHSEAHEEDVPGTGSNTPWHVRLWRSGQKVFSTKKPEPATPDAKPAEGVVSVTLGGGTASEETNHKTKDPEAKKTRKAAEEEVRRERAAREKAEQAAAEEKVKLEAEKKAKLDAEREKQRKAAALKLAEQRAEKAAEKAKIQPKKTQRAPIEKRAEKQVPLEIEKEYGSVAAQQAFQEQEQQRSQRTASNASDESGYALGASSQPASDLSEKRCFRDVVASHAAGVAEEEKTAQQEPGVREKAAEQEAAAQEKAHQQRAAAAYAAYTKAAADNVAETNFPELYSDFVTLLRAVLKGEKSLSSREIKTAPKESGQSATPTASPSAAASPVQSQPASVGSKPAREPLSAAGDSDFLRNHSFWRYIWRNFSNRDPFGSGFKSWLAKRCLGRGARQLVDAINQYASARGDTAKAVPMQKIFRVLESHAFSYKSSIRSLSAYGAWFYFAYQAAERFGLKGAVPYLDAHAEAWEWLNPEKGSNHAGFSATSNAEIQNMVFAHVRTASSSWLAQRDGKPLWKAPTGAADGGQRLRDDILKSAREPLKKMEDGERIRFWSKPESVVAQAEARTQLVADYLRVAHPAR